MLKKLLNKLIGSNETKKVELFKIEDLGVVEKQLKQLENEAILSRLKNMEKSILSLGHQFHKNNEENKLIKELLLHLSTNIEELLNATNGYENQMIEFNTDTNGIDENEIVELNKLFGVTSSTTGKPN